MGHSCEDPKNYAISNIHLIAKSILLYGFGKQEINRTRLPLHINRTRLGISVAFICKSTAFTKINLKIFADYS